MKHTHVLYGEHVISHKKWSHHEIPEENIWQIHKKNTLYWIIKVLPAIFSAFVHNSCLYKHILHYVIKAVPVIILAFPTHPIMYPVSSSYSSQLVATDSWNNGDRSGKGGDKQGPMAIKDNCGYVW